MGEGKLETTFGNQQHLEVIRPRSLVGSLMVSPGVFRTLRSHCQKKKKLHLRQGGNLGKELGVCRDTSGMAVIFEFLSWMVIIWVFAFH